MSQHPPDVETTLFNELTFKPTLDAVHAKDGRLETWPRFEIKGSDGGTFDICQTLEMARATIAKARLKRYSIYQLEQGGTKHLVERSHNEAGFAILNTTLQEKLRAFRP